MNSFTTREETLRFLEKYPELLRAGPVDFLQSKVPKIRADNWEPVSWPADPDLEWCPPGHGDIYTALLTSGMLQTLLDHGYEYAFVANADNLGATLDPLLLGYFVENRLPFLMEVADRTPADRKGGHLARRAGDGRLTLRESAQCPAEDMDAFQDIDRHRYFNTNNLWLNLPALKALMDEKGGILGLPLIRNSKTLDPRDPASPKVYQLETAMGAAVSLFEGAGTLQVPRTRFAPVKTCDDLLAVRSDAYVLTADWRVVPSPLRRLPEPPVVSLDPRAYKLVDDLEARFPFGPPSLVDCERLTVQGDVRFGRDVICRGAAEVVNETDKQAALADGQVVSEVVRLVNVRCYAGTRYPERPVAFQWEGRWLDVTQVEWQVRTPEGLRFAVIAGQGERYRLSWVEREDVWWGEEADDSGWGNGGKRMKRRETDGSG